MASEWSLLASQTACCSLGATWLLIAKIPLGDQDERFPRHPLPNAVSQTSPIPTKNVQVGQREHSARTARSRYRMVAQSVMEGKQGRARTAGHRWA